MKYSTGSHIKTEVLYFLLFKMGERLKGVKRMPTFSHGETEIFYEDKGSGVPIVFIHPPAMGRKVFYYQAHLAEHYRVIFPDLSGHGDTIGPIKDVSILGFAEEIHALLNHLQIEKAVICGYSSGGIVAQEFALSFPEKTIAVILSGGFPAVQSIGFKYEHLAGIYFVKHYPDTLAYMIATSHTKNKRLRNEIIEHMHKANRKVWLQFYERSLHYSCVDRLHQLKSPLLLLYGSRDLVNQHLRCYKRHTNCQAVIIPKVSHQLPTKKWQLFNQLISGFVCEQAYASKNL
jgi:pimeloyl-ACP methyl ester carboxylesterase